jgi:hypothetical protein
VIRGLETAGHLESVQGEAGAGLFDPDTRRPMRSRMRATNQLYAMLREHGVRLKSFVDRRSFLPVRIKDKNKVLIAPPRGASKRIKEISKNLEIINELIESTFVGLHLTDAKLRAINSRLTEDPHKVALDFTKKRLYRVFSNGSLERNGRFSGGWWQNVPSEYRPHIYIGGPKSFGPKMTAELDYSAMFPSIAYALLGRTIDDTAYYLDGKEQQPEIRKVIKTALLTMLMAKNRASAAKAIHKKLSDDAIDSNPAFHDIARWKKRSNTPFQLPYRACVPNGCPSIRTIIGSLEKGHPQLAEHFFYNPDQGLYLMYRESRVAERVLLYMAEKGVPVLPIHDSFVVMTSWAGYAHLDNPAEGSQMPMENIMRMAFREELGVECKLKFDKREFQTKDPNGPKGGWTDGPTLDELNNYDPEPPEYGTYNRLHQDWYKQSRNAGSHIEAAIHNAHPDVEP